MSAEPSRARIAELHELALGMPQVTVSGGSSAHPVYQVGAKSFSICRTARPDATDPTTGGAIWM